VKAAADRTPLAGRKDEGWDETVLVWNGTVATIPAPGIQSDSALRRRLPPAAAASELAVASDAVNAIGVDEIASATARDRVACAVRGVYDVAAGSTE
jgi:hypothetical protein